MKKICSSSVCSSSVRVVLLCCFPIIFNTTFFNGGGGAMAFHNVYPDYQSLSAVNVNLVHKPAYHFQPKQNWINVAGPHGRKGWPRPIYNVYKTLHLFSPKLVDPPAKHKFLFDPPRPRFLATPLLDRTARDKYPNGPMYYKGFYHFFCQYNPKGAVWGNIVWAHSVSKDMINWIPLKPAIVPSKWFDKYGCWSGSATILPGDKPVILYTGVIKETPDPGYQVQNYAIPANYSDPCLQDWVKPDNNPILKPTRENVSSFRDPSTAWFNNGQWKMLIGSRYYDRGIAYLYRSKDFVKWTRAERPFHEKSDTGMWECPDFYPVSSHGNRNGLDTSTLGKDTKYVFKVSLDETRDEYYTIGEYDAINDRYLPYSTTIDGWAGLRYDYGNFYASKTFFDPVKKRRILWGWANESSTSEENVAKGWAGIQLIPRMVWLDPSGKQLLQWPIQELETLRGQNKNVQNVNLYKGDTIEINGISADQADVDVCFKFSRLRKADAYNRHWDKLPRQDLAEDLCGIMGATIQGGLGPFGILTLASKNLEEYTPVFFRVFKTREKKYKVLMCSDATPSSTNTQEYKPSFGGFVDVDLADKKLCLRSLIDHSVVESFAEGGKTVITSRVYPELAVGLDAHLHVFNNGTEPITIERLDAWSMNTPMMN